MNNLNLVTTNKSDIDYNEYEEVCGSVVFPELYSAQDGVALTRRVNRHPNVPTSNVFYQPDLEILREIVGAWYGLTYAMGAKGETGTGKTEMFQFVCERLNEPMYILQLNGGLLPEMVEGRMTLKDGNTSIELGPLAIAYEEGGLIVLDELDKANTALQSWLHPVLERKALALAINGKNIEPHDQLRIACTANTFGEGGSERYSSSNKLDDALRARIGWWEFHYPTASVLRNILKSKFPMIPSKFRTKMIQVTEDIQRVTVDEDSEISAIFSTRTLVNWGDTMLAFGVNSKIERSLHFPTRGACDPADWDALKEIFQRILGDDLKLSVTEMLEKYEPKSKKG
jgi:cobaltochelatase CobS